MMMTTTTTVATSACFLDLVPFRGAPCSDAAGKQVGLSDILTKLLPSSSDGGTVHYDERASSPYFDYDVPDDTDDPNSRRHHRVWFDCPRSLTEKYRLAKSFTLAGVGFWNIDSLDYESDAFAAQRIRTRMFEALDAFLL